MFLQIFHIFHMRLSESVKGVLMLMWKPRHHFNVKTKKLADFQIYISVPISSCLWKLEGCFIRKYDFRSVCLEKF